MSIQNQKHCTVFSSCSYDIPYADHTNMDYIVFLKPFIILEFLLGKKKKHLECLLERTWLLETRLIINFKGFFCFSFLGKKSNLLNDPQLLFQGVGWGLSLTTKLTCYKEPLAIESLGALKVLRSMEQKKEL